MVSMYVLGIILKIGDHKASASLVCTLHYLRQLFIASLVPEAEIVGGFVIDVSNVFAKIQLEKLVLCKCILRYG